LPILDKRAHVNERKDCHFCSGLVDFSSKRFVDLSGLGLLLGVVDNCHDYEDESETSEDEATDETNVCARVCVDGR